MAATVVDALVVSLALDSTNFQKGMAQAVQSLAALKGQSAQVNLALNQTGTVATRTASTMQAQGKVAGDFFSQIKNQALSLIGVLLGGRSILGFAEHATTSLSAMGRAARNTGDSVQSLATFRNAVEATGGNADAAAATRQKLADSLKEIDTTGTSANMIGLAQTIEVHTSDTPDRMFQRFIEYAEKYKGDPRLLRQKLTQAGVTDEGTQNLLLLGKVRVEKELAEARLRGTPTDEMIANVTRLQSAWAKVMQVSINLANVLFADLAPALTKILETIREFMAANPVATKAIGAAGATLATTAAVGGTLALVRMAIMPLLGLAGVAVGGSAAVPLGIAAAIAAAGGLAYYLLAPSAAKATPSKGALPSGGPGPAAQLAAPQATGGAADPPTLFATIESAQGLPAGILDAVWEAESGRGRHMRSPAGAKGHMGFMDATAREYGVDNPDDLGQSSRGSGKDLHDLLRKYNGDPRKALAAYNWGQGNLDKDIASRGADWERGLPAETSAYLARIGRTMSGANRYPGQGGGSAGQQAQNISVTGPITIHTAANDAAGIARDFRRELSGRRIAQQANTGLA